MADLTGVKAKFNHAQTHIKAFDRCFSDFLGREPYSLTLEFDPNTGGYRSLWRVLEQPPLELSLINGDIWTNLRASLDYLVWQLVLANDQTPTDRTAFPCAKASQHWASATGDRLRGVDGRWVDEIEKLQPYHRGDRPELHPLTLLDSFNNLNKHRLMPPALTAPVDIEFVISGGHGYKLEGRTFLERPIEDGAEFMTIHCEPAGPIADLQMAVNPRAVFHISFLDGLNSPWQMDDVNNWVERSIAIFEPAFAS